MQLEVASKVITTSLPQVEARLKSRLQALLPQPEADLEDLALAVGRAWAHARDLKARRSQLERLAAKMEAHRLQETPFLHEEDMERLTLEEEVL